MTQRDGYGTMGKEVKWPMIDQECQELLTQTRVAIGGQHSTAVAFSLHDPAGPGSIPSVPEIFSRKNI